MDKKILDEWKKLNNILIGSTKGGSNNQIINFMSDGKIVSGKCFGDVTAGDAIAFKATDEIWYIKSSTYDQNESYFRKNVEYRKCFKKKRISSDKIYIELIGINLSMLGITISLKDFAIQSTLAKQPYTKLEGENLSFEMEDFMTEGSDLQFKETIDAELNQDADKITIVYSDKSNKFNISDLVPNSIAYKQKAEDNGSFLDVPKHIDEDRLDSTFCITNCKPFVLTRFVSDGSQGIYTKDLNFFFNNPIAPLVRKIKSPEDRNRNFINLWILKDRAGFEYARGYVSDLGFLKISNKLNYPVAGLRDDYVFFSKFNYAANIELQIGCGNVVERKVTWFTYLGNKYFTNLMSNDYLPFSLRT